LDPPSWILLFFLKSHEITEINTKSRQNTYKMYKLVNFWNLMKKTGKKTTELCQRKLIFGQTHKGRMNEQLLKVSAH